MKVLVAVGMTGGHIIPGIAVAGELKSLDKSCELVFAGASRGRAKEIASRAGYRFISVSARGWAGAGVKGKIAFVFLMTISIVSALSAMRRERPNVFVGTGSYACVPFAIGALAMGIPIVLLEQNVVPGVATGFLSRFAREVHVAYRESARYLSKKTRVIVSGNPVRKSLFGQDKTRSIESFGLSPDVRTVLAFGGSRGARSINRAFADAAPDLADHKLQFIVQTGEEDLAEVKEACVRANLKSRVMPFIYEMEKAYACADLVVCRAGATTLAELTSLGLPSIMVPFPYSAGGHQEQNALTLEKAGASVMVHDRDLTGKLLASLIIGLAENAPRLESMAKTSSKLGMKDAGVNVALSIMRLGQGRSV